MALGQLESIYEFSAPSVASSIASSGMDRQDLLEISAAGFAPACEQAIGSRCIAGIRFAIVLEFVAAVVIYGAWKLIH